MPENSSVTLPGKVEKIIPAVSRAEPETVQISVESAHHLYRDLRIDNTLTSENGDRVSLKLGSPVEVTISAVDGSTTIQSRQPFTQEP